MNIRIIGTDSAEGALLPGMVRSPLGRASRAWIDGGLPGDLRAAGAGIESIAFPGIKWLFTLRRIDDIKIRHRQLEGKAEKVMKHEKYPDFAEETEEYCTLKLHRILKAFNTTPTDS